MRKDASVMTFESYLQRIMSLCNYDASAKKPKTMIQKIFQVKNTEMKMVLLFD